MLAQARVKTITIHTRKETIAILQELKHKINAAYQTQTHASLQSLLTLLRIIYYLAPLPHFIQEINTIGSLPLSVFLQNLLIKSRMIRWQFNRLFQSWIAALLYKMQECIPNSNMQQMKVLKEVQFCEINYNWEIQPITQFIQSSLQQSTRLNDFGLLASLVIFIRNFFVYCEQKHMQMIEVDWSGVVAHLTKGSWILNSIVRQQNAICINHYLCLKNPHLCRIALDNGIVNYLLHVLNSKFIFESLGRKIIQFLTYLLFYGEGGLKEINAAYMEQTMSRFIGKYNSLAMVLQARNLMAILDKKCKINHEAKLQKIQSLFQCDKNVEDAQIVKELSIVSLYAQSHNMAELLVKSHQKFHRFLALSSNENIVKIIIEILSFAFKSGKVDASSGQKIINKIDKMISNKNSKEKLNADRKRILIDLVKIIKVILQNREFSQSTIEQIKKVQLLNKLWSYSDCTNYEYEKELIDLGQQLGNKPSHEVERNIFLKLQEDFIKKSRVNLNRATQQCCEEVRLLDDLLGKSINSLTSIEVSPQLSPIVCNYIHTSNEPASNLLHSLQQEDQRQLKNRLNLICCRFIMKLVLFKEQSQMQRAKLMQVAASEQTQELPNLIHHFFQSHHIPAPINKKAQETKYNELSQQVRCKNMVAQYFKDQQKDSSFIVGLSDTEIDIVLNELSQHESEQNMMKSTRLLLEISKLQVHSLTTFNKFGANIALMYSYILANYSQNHMELVLLLESLLNQFIRLHINLLYNDMYLDYNYWMEILTTMDSYFQVVLTKKRIILAQLIFQYLDLNKALTIDNIALMMDKHPRKQLIRSQAFQSKGETLGYCIGSLLPNNGVHYMQGIALQHKQNVLHLLKESGCISAAKFIALFYGSCEQSIFREYQLDEWTQAIVLSFEQEADLQTIVNKTQQATMKLRKISQYVQVLFTLNNRKELVVKKNLLFAQEDVLIQSLKSIIYIVQAFQAEQFKRYLLEQLVVKIILALANLYRNNFKLMKTKCGDLIQYFQYLLSINGEQIKDAVCQLMRFLLLKKQPMMMNCQTYNACKMYKQSLSPQSQQQIEYCELIEHILYEGGEIEEQENGYFTNTANNRSDLPTFEHVNIATASAYLIAENGIENEDYILKKKASENSEPLFLEYASERQVSKHEQAVVGSDKLQEQRQKSKQYNFIEEPSISETIEPSKEQNKNKEEMIECRQNEFDRSTKIISQLEKCWTQQQLYEKIEKYLEDGKSIKQIMDNLIPISNKRYYNLLVQLFLKTKNSYSPNYDPSKLPLQQIHSQIIQCLPKEYCQLNDNFYQILGSGLEGARLGLKCKNIGLRGLEIYCKKFMNSLKMEQTSRYAELLSQKKSFQELKYMKTCKIYEVVNDKVLLFIDSNYPITHLCTLVSETCRYPPLCNSYELVEPLCSYVVLQSIDPSLRQQILTTINNLCKYSEKHKGKVQNSQFLTGLVEMLQKTDSDELNVISGLLLVGMEENAQIAQLYQRLSLEEIILHLLRKKIQSSQENYQLFINLLKILECLATLPQSAQRILKRGFMGLCKPITAFSIKEGQFDLIGCIINILRNLLEEMELNLNKVFTELQKDGFLQYLLFIGPFLGRSHQVQNYLNIYCKLIPNSATGKKIIQKLQVMLQVLSELARDQLLTQVLVQTWMKLLFLLVQSNRFGLISQILKSNIFFSAAISLKTFSSLSDKIIGMNNRMMREVVSKDDLKAVLTVHGYADFLVQILKMENLLIDDYLKMLTTFSQLSKNRIFNSKLCTELFAVVIRKLQLGWKDDIAMGSIILLKSIKQKVEATTEFGENMLDFFGKFLTQSSKVTSPEYYSISREVICLLSYFLIFNDEIRFLFRTTLVLDILKNWLRISKALAYTEMPQAYKLFYHSIYSSQNLYVDLCGVNSKRLAEAELAFERGWKCNLYRLNGSYKQAVLKIDRSKREIFCYKHPDGIIKDKYRINVKDLLVIQTYINQKDPLFLQGNFTRTNNIFQHKAEPTHCLTLLGLNQANFEVREISIEVLKSEDLQQIYESATLLVSKWHEQAVEEQARVWQLVNKKNL